MPIIVHGAVMILFVMGPWVVSYGRLPLFTGLLDHIMNELVQFIDQLIAIDKTAVCNCKREEKGGKWL